MKRPWNFSAGPSTLPKIVLEQAASEMFDWNGTGMSVMEMSHRGKDFTKICDEAESILRNLLNLSNEYAVLFIQGGATTENAAVPLNLINRSKDLSADFIVTGHWSKRSYKEFQKYGKGFIIASNEEERLINQKLYSANCWLPSFDELDIHSNAAYLHICSNETITGTEFFSFPDPEKYKKLNIPLVVDASSNFLSRSFDFSKIGLLYAGAQKNSGIAGVTIVIVRRELIGNALSICPSALDYLNISNENSKFNTPSTYAIYISGLVFKWIENLGGISVIENRNIQKAKLLYEYLDRTDFYFNKIEPSVRSRMNIPFFLKDEKLTQIFLEGAIKEDLINLKGHNSIGGIRASIYNAMPFEGVKALVDYMKKFEQRHG